LVSSIRVSFTVADIQNISEQEDFDDAALTDDLDYQKDSQRNQEGADELENTEPSFPARVNITVEKPNNGALLIQTVVQDDVFQIEEVSHFAKAELAQAQTAEKDWARQSLYAGPPFENLDEDLQSLWDRYLEDRGINAEFATMVPDYISVKEQKEYIRWLESMYPIIYTDMAAAC
jgi:complement component 1 Q subcomponent-binding protein